MSLEDIEEKMKAPFPANKIHWRVGRKTKAGDKAIPFAYLTARDVMDRLDEVCGIGGWQAEHPFHGCSRIGVKVNDEWVWKANMADDTAIEALKGGASDAFKRAAVLFGIGRYLYDVPNIWVAVGQYGFEEPVINDLNHRYNSWVENYFKKKGE